MTRDAAAPMTPDDLRRAIERLLRTADQLGLTAVGIKLNEAVVALDRSGSPPPERRTAARRSSTFH